MAQDAAPSAPFHTSLVTRGQAIAMLSGAAIMLSIAMGVRQSLGLFQTPVVQDLGIAAADYAMAIAVQNIVWGFTQPVAGAFVDRFGTRWIALTGVVDLHRRAGDHRHGDQSGHDHAGRRRADRRRALVHDLWYCLQHRRARGGTAAAQPGVRHRLGGRLDGHVLLCAAGPARDLEWRLAGRPGGIRDRRPADAAGGLHRRTGRAAAQLDRARCRHDPARRAGRGAPARRLRHHEPRVLRVRAAAGVPHHAPAELPRAVRHGPAARRAGAGRDRALQCDRLVGLRLARRPLSQAHAAGPRLHHPLGGDRGLLHAAGDADLDADLRGR